MRLFTLWPDDMDSFKHGANSKSKKSIPVITPAPTKPAVTEEQMEKKSEIGIQRYLHIYDARELLQCGRAQQCLLLCLYGMVCNVYC